MIFQIYGAWWQRLVFPEQKQSVQPLGLSMSRENEFGLHWLHCRPTTLALEKKTRVIKSADIETEAEHVDFEKLSEKIRTSLLRLLSIAFTNKLGQQFELDTQKLHGLQETYRYRVTKASEQNRWTDKMLNFTFVLN